jgi:hypothetical protein
MSGNRSIAKCIRFVRREFGESLQLKQLAILLEIGMADPKPVTYTELMATVDTTSGTVSRTIALYG